MVRDRRKRPSDCGLATRFYPNVTARSRLLRPQDAEIVRAASIRFMWQRTSMSFGAETFEPAT